MVALVGGEPRALTSGGGYRSPIIMPDGAVLALKGEDLMRIPAAGGAPVRMRALPGALKLVGADLGPTRTGSHFSRAVGTGARSPCLPSGAARLRHSPTIPSRTRTDA